MIYIIIEKSYAPSTWCKDIMRGILEGLTKKKLSYKILSELSEYTVKKPEEPDFAFILSGRATWGQSIANQCAQYGMHPILLNSYVQNETVHSTVFFDYYSNMQEIQAYLAEKGKKRVALFAISPESAPNQMIRRYFLDFFPSSREQDIFYRCPRDQKRIRNCFEDYLPHFEEYDAVICSNAHTAVYLISQLRQKNLPLQNLLLVSYGDSILLSKTGLDVTIISLPHVEYGMNAVSVVSMLQKHPQITSLTASVKCHIYETRNLPKFYQKARVTFPSGFEMNNPAENSADRELSEIIMIETMLVSCSPLELKIIDLLLEGMTYESIANICEHAPNTVKYHTKKLFVKTGCTSRSSFEALLRRYFHTVN